MRVALALLLATAVVPDVVAHPLEAVRHIVGPMLKLLP